MYSIQFVVALNFRTVPNHSSRKFLTRRDKMAEFLRGSSAVIMPKEKLHGSPSTGSEEGHDGGIGEEFDPFLADQDEGDGANISMLGAPPETQ